MTRLLKTAEEIREEISRLIHEKPGVKEDHAKIGVSLPTEMFELDPQGGLQLDHAYGSRRLARACE
jgi:hypothetical protein